MATMDAGLLEGVPPAVAVWCAGLDRGQGRVFDVLKDLTPEQLARVPEGLSNSIATLVVHVAAVEVRMAHRIQGTAAPADLQAEFLLDRPQNPLPAPSAETAESLRGKAAKARDVLRAALAGLTEADLGREVLGPNGTATVRLALSILPAHQMLHFGQMQIIRKLV